mmetsp:Transcript_57388/g.124739  ORF Transcript_57388/g.124739 Transcript_57388/m.124739 type:complete len:221 (+) Transcript_57388:2-664(+)
MAQNEHEHTTPDWKFHFSTAADDVPLAWNVLARLFIEAKCDIGMKATITAGDTWPRNQWGRELTVYVYKHSSQYDKGGPMAELAEEGEEHLFWLGSEFEVADVSFWFRFILAAERRLADAGVRRSPAGIADGDMALPGCHYASLRNEAFVVGPTETALVEGGSVASTGLIYPPNDAGWNAAQHFNPLLPTLSMLQAHFDALNLALAHAEEQSETKTHKST